MINECWFWLSLVICPALILTGLYEAGKLYGATLFTDNFSLADLDSYSLVMICAIVPAAYTLVRACKRALIRWTVK